MRHDALILDAKRIAKREDEEDWLFTCDLQRIPDPTRYSFQTAIGLIQKYELPCDVEIRELRPPFLAAHLWRHDDTCAVVISERLNFDGDRRSIRRRILHEIAHHIAGRGHGHDDVFKNIASHLYESEGYPKGTRGDQWGNL